jgi:T5orf172 domain
MEKGIIYILTNPAMPNLVKIGKTSRDDVKIRMGELYKTGVPVPFECSFAGKVNDINKIEKAFHKAFRPYRINKNREFFEIEPEQAIGLLEIICDEDVTPQVAAEPDSLEVDTASIQAGKRLANKRRQRFNFLEMGIPIGSILDSNYNDETCKVVNEKQVNFRNEVMSFTRATRIKLDNKYNVAPAFYWLFNGVLIRDIYNETYSE